jgi:gamma-glutamyltranspeptidase
MSSRIFRSCRRATASRSLTDRRGQAAALVDVADDRLRQVGTPVHDHGVDVRADDPNQVAKTLVAVIDWKLDPQAAVTLPNFGSRNGPTELERDTAAAALAPKLQALGHDTVLTGHNGGAHAIVRTRNGWSGGADPRREGDVRGD